MFHCLLCVGEVTKSLHNVWQEGFTLLARHYCGTPLEAHTLVAFFTFSSTKTDQLGVKNQWTWAGAEEWDSICPIKRLLSFLEVRGELEWFFCSQDGSPVHRSHFVNWLSEALQHVLGPGKTYKSHSLRMGGAAYLLLSGWAPEQIMAQG